MQPEPAIRRDACTGTPRPSTPPRSPSQRERHASEEVQQVLRRGDEVLHERGVREADGKAEESESGQVSESERLWAEIRAMADRVAKLEAAVMDADWHRVRDGAFARPFGTVR